MQLNNGAHTYTHTLYTIWSILYQEFGHAALTFLYLCDQDGNQQQ